MSSSAEQQLLYKVANMNVLPYPFPHFYVENVFSEECFNQMREHFPSIEHMPTLKSVRPVVEEYTEQRLCVPMTPEHVGTLPQPQRAFWSQTSRWLLGQNFLDLLIRKFQPYLEERFQDQGDVTFESDALLVDDHTRFFLGPHSDSPKKVLTLLFYLPGDLSQEHLGTSIYVAKDPNFRCRGGPHYAFDKFERVFTAPFRPNALFGFVKTANSFHGVEPLKENESCRRQLLLYDVYVPPEFALGGRIGAQQATPAPKPQFGFRF